MILLKNTQIEYLEATDKNRVLRGKDYVWIKSLYYAKRYYR